MQHIVPAVIVVAVVVVVVVVVVEEAGAYETEARWGEPGGAVTPCRSCFWVWVWVAVLSLSVFAVL